jgi:hypothetical protein
MNFINAILAAFLACASAFPGGEVNAEPVKVERRNDTAAFVLMIGDSFSVGGYTDSETWPTGSPYQDPLGASSLVQVNKQFTLGKMPIVGCSSPYYRYGFPSGHAGVTLGGWPVITYTSTLWSTANDSQGFKSIEDTCFSANYKVSLAYGVGWGVANNMFPDSDGDVYVIQLGIGNAYLTPGGSPGGSFCFGTTAQNTSGQTNMLEMFWTQHAVAAITDLLGAYDEVLFLGLVDTIAGGQINGSADPNELGNFVTELEALREKITNLLNISSGSANSWIHIKPSWLSPQQAPFTNGTPSLNSQLVTELNSWDTLQGNPNNRLVTPVTTSPNSGTWSNTYFGVSSDGVHWKAGTTIWTGNAIGQDIVTYGNPIAISSIDNTF